MESAASFEQSAEAEAPGESSPPHGVDELPADLSSSLRGLRERLQGSVTSCAVVRALLADPSHAGYGSGTARSVEVADAPDGAETGTVDEWIDAVRPLFLPQEPFKLDGRKLLYGLALLDQDLRRQLDEHGFLSAVEPEIPIHQQLSGRGKALYKADAVPTLSDQPADIDLLGRQAFAEALAERLRDEFRRSVAVDRTPDSFMLHLEGPWGSGKTSLLRFLSRELRKDPEPWLVVEFNAWQNQRAGAPWWLMIWAVLRAAVADPATATGVRRRLRLRALWWRVKLALPQLMAVGVALGIVFVLWLTGALTKSDPLAIVTGAISAVVAAVSGLHGLASSVTGGSKQGAEAFIRQTGDPMNSLRHRFNDLVDAIARPIAICIDDLDRCGAEYVVDLLEGVQTIFRDAPVAWVVAADRHWLYDAYAKVYGDYGKTGIDPGRPLGHLFLEKTFQLSTSVPRISPGEQRAYWERLLSPRENGDHPDPEELARTVQADFAGLQTEDAILGELDRNPGQTPDERRARREAAVRRLSSPTLQRHIEHTLTSLAPLLEPNPRAMKRLVNAYGVARAVQILEGHPAELEYPRERLALWTILRSRWPLLSDYLAEDPDALDDLKKGRLPARATDDSERPYLKKLFESRDAKRVALGEGLDGVELDPASLRFLIDAPDAERVYG